MMIAVKRCSHLEEVIFEEVPQRLVRGHGPPRVVIQVKHGQHQHQHQRAELGAVSHRHQDHENASKQVLRYLERI